MFCLKIKADSHPWNPLLCGMVRSSGVSLLEDTDEHLFDRCQTDATVRGTKTISPNLRITSTAFTSDKVEM